MGDTLFVASRYHPHLGVIAFDLTDGSIIFEKFIGDQQFLNDITTDTSGYLYTTECELDMIFKVNLSDLTYSIFVSTGLSYPNGILFDAANNRLLVVNSTAQDGPIMAVSLEDSTLSTLALTYLPLDGLTMDSDGYVYFSSWQTASVYRFDPLFAAPRETISSGHDAPADIFFNKIDNILVVPNLRRNEVDFIHFDDSDGDGLIDINDNCPMDYNPDQSDTDEDGIADSCDNCPETFNSEQNDSDSDMIGDVCDDCTDTDGDGYGNPGYTANTCAEDNCPDDYNPDQADSDADGIGDACCCINLTGNIDNDLDDLVDLGDLTKLIDYLFISFAEPGCLKEANTDGDLEGLVDLGDLTKLIDYLFISFQTPAECP